MKSYTLCKPSYFDVSKSYCWISLNIECTLSFLKPKLTNSKW